MLKLLLIFALLLDSRIAFSEDQSNFENVAIDRVYDGDTFFISLKDLPAVFSNIGVRIRGIDSAEIHGKTKCERKEAQIAKQALQTLIGDNPIDLLNCSKDKYFRLLCDGFLGSVSIAAWMIDKGYAVIYEGEKKPAWVCR